MNKNRIRMLGLFLLGTLCFVNICLQVGPTYAHYPNTLTYSTLLESPEDGIQSSFLEAGGNSLALSGKLDEQKEVSFLMESKATDASGNFSWYVEQGYEDLVEVSAKAIIYSEGEEEEPAEPIERGKPFDLPKGSTAIVTMTFSPAETSPQEDAEVDVIIGWGGMNGTFTVLIPSKTAPENETETAQPEPAEAETDALPADTAEEGETGLEEVPEGSETDSIGISNPITFHPDFLLPVIVDFEGEISSFRLGLAAEDGSLTPFPDYTVFIIEGKRYTVYDGEIPEFEIQDETKTEIPVLLDLSRANFEEFEVLNLLAEGTSGGTTIKSEQSLAVPDAILSCKTIIHSSYAELETEVESEIVENAKSEEPTAENGWGSRILGKENALEITFPVEWIAPDIELEYSLEILTKFNSETGEDLEDPVYKPVEEESMAAEYIADAGTNTHSLIIRMKEKLPQAGTYRVNLRWEYRDICFAEKQITFFINYSTQTESTQGI